MSEPTLEERVAKLEEQVAALTAQLRQERSITQQLGLAVRKAQPKPPMIRR